MIYLRLIQPENVMQCLAIIKENWVSPRESRKPQIAHAEINQAFTNDIWKPTFYVALDDLNYVLGLAGYHISWLDYGIYEISWVNVSSVWQSKGVGKTLVQKCLEDISTLGHTAMLATHIPDYFSTNFGFEKIANYGVPPEMTIMMKTLSKEKGQ
jgi:N-acetylglutamate synthase-like GNAT family acetyltransferase